MARVFGFIVSDGQGEYASHDAGRRERFGADGGAVIQGQFPGRPGLTGISGCRGTVTTISRVHQWPGPGTVFQEARRENCL